MRPTAVAAIGLIAFASFSTHPAAHPRTDVTWSKEIVRILERRCAGCHYRGAIGPMDLTDYADARQWGQTIKRAVLERRMPPWQPAVGFGDFSNDRSLTPYELDLLIAWVNGGMRVGLPSDLPAEPRPVPATTLDHADVVLRAPVGHRVTQARHTFEMATGLTADRWIAGWEFQPDNVALIKYATVSVGDVVLGTWTPGEPTTVLPDGVGQRLPAGSPLRLDVHFREPAEAAVDHSGIALHLTDHVVRELAHLEIGVGDQRLTDSVEVLAIRPRLSSSRDSMQALARRPDGSSEVLLVMRRYDSDAPMTYRFRRPVRLPAGTIVDVRSFDPDGRVDLELVRGPTVVTPVSRRR